MRTAIARIGCPPTPTLRHALRAARLRAEVALDEEIILRCAADLARKRAELEQVEAIAAEDRAVAEIAGQPVTMITNGADDRGD